MPQVDRVQHIDAWRFLAVVMVIMHHLVNFTYPRFFIEYVPGIVWRMPALGKLGVLIFFCISGFVICGGLVKEQSTSSRVSLAAFYVRRALRIVPPLFLYLFTLSLLTVLGFISLPWTALIQSATFTCNFRLIGDCGWLAGHTWSLAYEEQFYLLFPILYVFLTSVGRGRVVWILVLLGLTMTGVFFARMNGLFGLADYLTTHIYILAGCAASLYWKAIKPMLSKVPWLMWLTGVFAMFGLSGVIPVPAYLSQIVNLAVLPALVCFVVLGTPVSRSIVKAIFRNNFVSYLGKISYTVYLWQQLATANQSGISPWRPAILIILVFVFAHFSYRLFELPLMRMGRDFSTRIREAVIAVK
jgi:peptidoglycan/LPS O-acetylase OafA/YrhL